MLKSGAAKGFVITLALWVALLGANSLVEMARGHHPFAMFQWNMGGKFVTIVMIVVLALGTAVGMASDSVRRRMGR